MSAALLALAAVGGSISGAATSVELPRYRVNDAFVFSDGRVERVVKVSRKQVTWTGLTGSPYVRSPNFVLPVESWSVRKGLGRRQFFGTADALWPVTKPRTVRFRVVSETKPKPKSPWQREVSMWTCQSLKPKVVRIALGDFNTIPFQCDRYSATNMRPLERLEWDYAPEIGHYVRRSSIQYLRGTRRTIDLVAMISGPSATRRRLQALSKSARQKALPIS